MTVQPTPVGGGATKIVSAGHSIIVTSVKAVGGYIINPANAVDQRLTTAAILYVDPTGPAANHSTGTTVAIQPGGRYDFPSNISYGVWVNSNSSGHNFIVVQLIPSDQLPETEDELLAEYKIVDDDFPPTGPTGALTSIRSYLYQEYSDDEDLQAFVKAYNDMNQDIVDTYNGLNLPIYNQDPVSGALLDWVGNGVYGYPRPVLVVFDPNPTGPYNTFLYNRLWAYNRLLQPGPIATILSDDDIYRRCLTWHFFKADGKYFSIAWLKKRVMRWLIGTNGTCPVIDQTYQVSITFNPYGQLTIRLINGLRTITSSQMYNAPRGAIYNNAIINSYNAFNSTYQHYTPLPFEQQFAAAIASGVLELPFQFTYIVVIG